MKLYHGSLNIVSHPEIRSSNRTLDFGKGFYTTTDLEQARRWVEIRKKSFKATEGYINIYEFDDSKLTSGDLSVLRFEKPTEEWVDFVIENRVNPEASHCFDLVIGPVADDRVFGAILLFQSDYIDKPTLIKDLKAYKLVDQLLFHSPESLEHLSFTEAIKV